MSSPKTPTYPWFWASSHQHPTLCNVPSVSGRRRTPKSTIPQVVDCVVPKLPASRPGKLDFSSLHKYYNTYPTYV
eukprot:scaffold5810_cov148-Skeletonema_marinoi.AAC.4